MLCHNCNREIEYHAVCPYCGTRALKEPLPHHLPVGTVIDNRYKVMGVLGEGGFGVTYLGYNQRLGLPVAIKEFFPRGVAYRESTGSNKVYSSTDDGAAFFNHGKERFLSEAKTLVRFNAEPGIVSVMDFVDENNTAYLIMEYLDGETLQQYLKKHGTLSADEAFSMLEPMMRTLEKVHRAGIIHRDISPDNIMVLGDGSLKLMDFGAARDYSDENRSMSVMLKKGYAPEEQYRRNGEQGPWTDVYALCATIYRCITGAVPLDSLDRMAGEAFKKPSELGANISPAFEKVLLKGMAVKKADRIQGLPELLRLMEYATRPVQVQKPAKVKAEAAGETMLLDRKKEPEPVKPKEPAEEIPDKREETVPLKDETKKADPNVERITATEDTKAEEPDPFATLNANLDRVTEKPQVTTTLPKGNPYVATEYADISPKINETENPGAKKSALIKNESKSLTDKKRLELVSKVQQEVKDEKEKKKKNKRLIIAIISIILLVAFTIIITLSNSAEAKYQKAVNLLKEGEYSEAIDIFTEIDSYKDSDALMQKSNYLYAQQLFSNKSYSEAALIFEQLGEYEDSAEMVKKCDYSYAQQLYSNKSYSDAVSIFQSLGEYEDSGEMVKKCNYSRANEFYSKGQYKAAKTLFSDLGSYKNSTEMVQECEYQSAKIEFNNKIYSSAITSFRKLGDYKDSKTMLQKAKLEYCKNNLNNDDECTYLYLKELKKAGNKTAKTLYSKLYSWKVSEVVWNTDEDDYSKNMKKISKYKPVYIHFSLSGGTPKEKTRLSVKYTLPSGEYGGKEFSEDSENGYSCSYGWGNTLYNDPDYGMTGTLYISIYDGKGNELYSGSVEITS